MVTHVAFQTGSVDGSWSGCGLGPLRHGGGLVLCAVGLSALAPTCRSRPRPAPQGGLGTGRYLRHRVVRIWPAYVVVVVVVLCLLPDARPASFTVWIANLTLTQIYVPLTLTAGLTQMWSLSVEVSFYLALPLIAWLMLRLRGTVRRGGGSRCWSTTGRHQPGLGLGRRCVATGGGRRGQELAARTSAVVPVRARARRTGDCRGGCGRYARADRAPGTSAAC